MTRGGTYISYDSLFFLIRHVSDDSVGHGSQAHRRCKTRLTLSRELWNTGVSVHSQALSGGGGGCAAALAIAHALRVVGGGQRHGQRQVPLGPVRVPRGARLAAHALLHAEPQALRRVAHVPAVTLQHKIHTHNYICFINTLVHFGIAKYRCTTSKLNESY